MVFLGGIGVLIDNVTMGIGIGLALAIAFSLACGKKDD
ncbi:hypothetical protein QFZ47_000096 [Variovorax paradoxus]|nr:hypothetical protein [Variovorax paradoxus]